MNREGVCTFYLLIHQIKQVSFYTGLLRIFELQATRQSFKYYFGGKKTELVRINLIKKTTKKLPNRKRAGGFTSSQNEKATSTG